MAYLGSSESKHYQGIYAIRKAYLGTTQVIDDTVNGLLDFYGGANAAYSLRSLSAAWSSQDVVEVRRASDDTTSGFTATEVSDGTMADWVNATVALPLDTASGAAAAYSLRNLSTSYSGNVVNVRRSSDGATADFTAAEVADDTLLDWVNNSSWTSAVNSSTSPYTTFTGASLSGFSATLTSGVAFAGFGGVSGVSGQVVSVSFDAVVNSGSPIISLRDSSTVINSRSNLVTISTSGSYTVDLTANAIFGFIGFSEGDAGSDFTISNFEVTAVSGINGYVSQWYDQSGNANHAEQTTPASQPKIVDAGTLVADGIQFDGANHWLETGSAFPTGTNISAFYVANSTGTDQRVLDTRGTGAAGTVQGWQLKWSNTLDIDLFDDGGSALQTLNISRSGLGLAATIASQTSVESYTDGALSASATGSIGSFDSGNPLTIGANQNGKNSQVFDGLLQEIIIYNSDQSLNRTAIESNMADHYGDINLPPGFDSGNNEVDGYVATWYDQSGNSNDAVQTTEASQPKIVENGNLLKDVNNNPEIKFKDSYLKTTQGYAVELSQNNSSVFAVTDAIVSKYLITEADATSSYSSNFIFGDNDGNSSLWVNSSEFGSSYPLVQALTGFIYDGTNFQAYINGGASGSSGTATVNTEVNGATFIGSQATDSTTQFYEGSIQEIIIYNSDQSDVRLGIEKEINDVYDIY